MIPQWKLIFILLILANLALWLAVLKYKPENFKLIACDVGQGDAILAISGKFQILTDGGLPNGKVIDCLSSNMPFWDRHVEVVINTHPQLDHYGGLIDVLQNYKVTYFIGNGLESSSSEYQVLKTEVGGRGVNVINPEAGMSIRYGKMQYDIFYPSKSFLEPFGDKPLKATSKESKGVLGAYTANGDPNDFSIQAILSYGEFNALLTGDIGPGVDNEVLSAFDSYKSSASRNLTIEYLKIPHHGSSNALTSQYLKTVNPKLAVISVGAKNTYGHPRGEILKMLGDRGIKVLRTDMPQGNDESGEVVVESDGTNYWVKE